MKNLLIMGTLLLSMNSFAGNEKGNGGFKYLYTSGKYLKSTKEFVSKSILDINELEIRKIEKKYNTQIDWKEFSQIVRTIQSQPDKEVSRPNPDGDTEPLIMDTDFTERKIVALKSFFDLFNKEELSNSEVSELSREILHETSHLFGIGVNNDDVRSRNFSLDLNKLVFSNLHRCHSEIDGGFLGAKKILDCSYASERNSNFSGNINISIENNTGVCQARVDLWEEGMNGYIFKGTLTYQHGDSMNIAIENLKVGTIITTKIGCVDVKSGISLNINIKDGKNETIASGSLLSNGSVATQKSFIKLENNQFDLY